MSLVGKYVGAAFGKSMSDAGEMMFRGQQQDDELAARAEERRLDREARIDVAGMRESAKEGNPGMTDAQGTELVAGLSGSTVPEVDAYQNAVRTGDYSALQSENPDIPVESLKAKAKIFYQLREQLTMGNDYKAIEEGRSEAHTRGLVDKAIADPGASPIIGQAVAAGRKGEGAYGGTDEVSRNEFTGEEKTTAVGRARISNYASASALDKARIEEIGTKVDDGTAGKEDSDRLTTIIEKSNSTLKQLMENPPPRGNKELRAEWEGQKKEWNDMRERARRLLDGRLDAQERPKTSGAPRGPQSRGGARNRDEKPAQKPTAPAGTAPKKDYRSLWK